jgi:radical SAM superfamily enzyme YgiQ (UPF0313 family)
VRITLVRPNIGRAEHSLYVDEARMEPLQLGLLAALTPPDVDVVLYDDRCEAIPFDEPTDLAAITVETFTARRAYEIADEYRARGVPVVMGGYHVTLIPDEAAGYADALVLGDAESVWPGLVEDARRGRLRPVYRAVPGVPQRGLLPRRDIFAGKGYLPVTLIQFGRGCPHECRFCAISAYFKRTHRTRPVSEVIREIEDQGRRTLFFVDDNITANRRAAKELFRALVPLRVRWVSQASIDMLADPELMELMVASGCLGHVIGFESVDPASLREMGKTTNLRGFRNYGPEMEALRGYGLQTWAAFTLGHDADTPATLERTLKFALEGKFTFAAFNILTPYPGTPLYARLESEGRLLYGGRWWLHPEYRFNHAAFRPRNMSPEELTAGCFDMRRRFNSPWSVLRRFLEPRTNMRSLLRAGVYWTYNPLFRRETFKKQGLRLGLA